MVNNKHHWGYTGEWGVVYAKCNKCGETVKFTVEANFKEKVSVDKDIQMIMDRHCNPDLHAEKVQNVFDIGGFRTYVLEHQR